MTEVTSSGLVGEIGAVLALSPPAPPQLVEGRDATIAYWCELQMPRLAWKTATPSQLLRAVGVGWNGDLIAGCLYHDPVRYQCANEIAWVVESTLVTTDPRWGTRRILRRLMEIAFSDLNFATMRARAAADNHAARSLLKRLGVLPAGRGRKARSRASCGVPTLRFSSRPWMTSAPTSRGRRCRRSARPRPRSPAC